MLISFDGTGNRDKPGTWHDTHVLKLFKANTGLDPTATESYRAGPLYLSGVGTRSRFRVFQTAAHAFGFGGHARVDRAIERTLTNVSLGDTVIDVCGFSRGAALAVSFCNELSEMRPNLTVRFLGLFDMVGQFGLPGMRLQGGHDLRMPPNVAYCVHAMALHENRRLFPLSRLAGTSDNVLAAPLERWFPGVHSDIGGGNGNHARTWRTLDWMYDHAIKAGLTIDPKMIKDNRRFAQRVAPALDNRSTHASRQPWPDDPMTA